VAPGGISGSGSDSGLVDHERRGSERSGGGRRLRRLQREHRAPAATSAVDVRDVASVLVGDILLESLSS
jgi:hypothetical protein